MAEDKVVGDADFEEQCRTLSEENKKLSIDIASLQLSNRSLVNQNRDEKKKVMDCRLQISDLESRLKTLESMKTELTECQHQAERLRASLSATESKLSSTERRATEAEGLVRIKDSIIEKQRNFSKELENQVKGLTERSEELQDKCGNLEMSLKEALDRAEDCDNLRAAFAAKTEILDQLMESSGNINEAGIAAAHEFFKSQEALMDERLTEMRRKRSELETTISSLMVENGDLKEKIQVQETELDDLKGKCAGLETRVKESGHSDRRSRADMVNSRLIGPALPPWIMEEKKSDPSELEKLANKDPAALRSRVLELEGQVHELNNLLTYREDVILRIHEEISKKASRLEAVEVERSSLSAQVSILKRELGCLRDDGPRRRGGYPPEIEIEIERLRGKRDREYQRRKRAEAEMDELDQENNELKAKIKSLEEAAVSAAKVVVPQSDPGDKSRIAELQAAASQLRMDNEAKRSELFDLRSRFDAKSTQLDKLAAEMKTKDRAVADLSAELTLKMTQLEQANKELESVRCRVVRGGSETERWQTDINSVRTTNRFLSAQANELRTKLQKAEEQLIFLQKQLINMKANGLRSPMEPHQNLASLCSACGGPMYNGVCETPADIEKIKEVKVDGCRCQELELKLNESSCREVKITSQIQNLISEIKRQKDEIATLQSKQLESANSMEQSIETFEVSIASWKKKCDDLENQLLQVTDSNDRALEQQVNMLNQALSKEQEASLDSSQQCAALTKRISDLEAVLENTRTKLSESTAENRRADLEQASQAAPVLSPPAKRARRTRSSTTGAQPTIAECSVCGELKRQVSALESDLSDSNSNRTLMVAELNTLRDQLVKATEETYDLRHQLNSLKADAIASLSKITNLKNAISEFFQKVDNNNAAFLGDISCLNYLRSFVDAA